MSALLGLISFLLVFIIFVPVQKFVKSYKYEYRQNSNNVFISFYRQKLLKDEHPISSRRNLPLQFYKGFLRGTFFSLWQSLHSFVFVIPIISWHPIHWRWYAARSLGLFMLCESKLSGWHFLQLGGASPFASAWGSLSWWQPLQIDPMPRWK